MKRVFIVILSVLFLFPINTYATECSASSAVVLDFSTKSVLYNQDMYARRSMASTTKIMTALLALESDRLDETVSITYDMVNVEGSSLGIKAGDTISLYDLIVGMMLTSGNDSANAVAIFIAGDIDSFVKRMNDRASSIGMIDTVFVTPSGLDEGNHHSTAYDMALLACEAVKNKLFCDIVSKQSADITISGNSISVYNHNKLLNRNKDIFGIKTGYTELAGRCLVSAKKYHNNIIICVTLNCPNDWEDHINLYNECEKQYSKVKINEAFSLPIAFGSKACIKATAKATLFTLGVTTYKAYYYPFVYPPIKAGEKLGYIDVYCKNILIERLPIEADEGYNYNGEQQSSKTTKVYGRGWSCFTKKK